MNMLCERAKRYGSVFEKAYTAKYIHEHCSHEAAEVIRQADMLMDQTFVYTDRWDMEPCPEPYTIPLDDWLHSPNGDPEWVFMLNRHDFLNKLMLAYALTGKKKYAHKLRWFILDWIAKNPITMEGTDATRTIDTGIRCMNWTSVLLHLLGEDLISDSDARRILDSMASQFENMRARYIGKYALSNWGVLQTTAICSGYVWFAECLPTDISKWAWEELKNQLTLQILEDGSHWEQSAMYHVEVLNTCTKLLCHLNYAKEIGLTLSDEARKAISSEAHWSDEKEASAGPGEGFDPEANGWLSGAIRVLSRHVLHTADPAFMQLAQCDSDVTDVRDVMARTAAMLPHTEIYRYAAGERMDLDSAWITGALGIRTFSGTASSKPEVTSWNCLDGGNIFFRNKWAEDADFTWMKCSTLGSSHGHADQTHLCIYRQGKPFLIDSGRYTYLEEDPLRTLLKKPCAHNVCVIDGQSGGEPDGSWSYHRYDETLKNYFSEASGAHYAEMGFHGALCDNTPYLIKRRVLTLDDGIWLSVQDIVCQGEHEVKEYFHLDDAVTVTEEQGDVLLKNGDVKLSLYSDDKVEVRHGVISKRYNEKITAPILIKKSAMKNRLTSQVLIADSKYKVNTVPVYQLRREQPLPPDAACAWNIEKPDGSRHILILVNREIYRGDKLLSCNGKCFYGKALVMNWNGDDCHVIRLRT